MWAWSISRFSWSRLRRSQSATFFCRSRLFPMGAPVLGRSWWAIDRDRWGLASGLHRADRRTRPHVPFSCHVIGDTAAGVNHTIPKPIDRNTLLFQIVGNGHEDSLLFGERSGHVLSMRNEGRRVTWMENSRHSSKRCLDRIAWRADNARRFLMACVHTSTRGQVVGDVHHISVGCEERLRPVGFSTRKARSRKFSDEDEVATQPLSAHCGERERRTRVRRLAYGRRASAGPDSWLLEVLDSSTDC